MSFPPRIHICFEAPSARNSFQSAKLYFRQKGTRNYRYNNVFMFTSQFIANLIDLIEIVIDSNR